MRNILRTVSNSKGISIIQALVGSFIASIVALGVSTMLVNSKIQTRKIQLLNTLTEQKLKIEFLLRDQNAFSQTINNNTAAIFVALKNSSAVTETNPATGAVELVIYDSAGMVAYDMLGPVASGLTGNGISEKGNPCTGFNGNPGAGNDDCPISYRILVSADCATGTSCLDPQLKIVARMMFNPSSAGSSQLNKFKNLLPQRDWTNVSSNSIADSVEDGKYDAVVKRTAASITKGFKLTVFHPNQSGSGPGGSGCPSPGWAIHPYLGATGWEEEVDAHSIVTINSSATNGQFTFDEAGYYSCSITAPAFAVNGFSIKLYNVTQASDVAIASSFSPEWSEAIARLETSLNVMNTAHNYTIQMKCDSAGSLPQWALGVSRSASYTIPFPMVVVDCTKVDTAF